MQKINSFRQTALEQIGECFFSAQFHIQTIHKAADIIDSLPLHKHRNSACTYADPKYKSWASIFRFPLRKLLVVNTFNEEGSNGAKTTNNQPSQMDLLLFILSIYCLCCFLFSLELFSVSATTAERWKSKRKRSRKTKWIKIDRNSLSVINIKVICSFSNQFHAVYIY